MWICLCKNLDYKQVEEAILKKSKDLGNIFNYYNKFPRCRFCLQKLKEHLIMETNKCKICNGRGEYVMPSGYDTFVNEPCDNCSGRRLDEEMVDVISVKHNSLGSGTCVFVLEKDECGNTKPNPHLLENINLFITEDESDWELTIKRYKMTKIEVENMLEFRGW